MITVSLGGVDGGSADAASRSKGVDARFASRAASSSTRRRARMASRGPPAKRAANSSTARVTKVGVTGLSVCSMRLSTVPSSSKATASTRRSAR